MQTVQITTRRQIGIAEITSSGDEKVNSLWQTGNVEILQVNVALQSGV